MQSKSLFRILKRCLLTCGATLAFSGCRFSDDAGGTLTGKESEPILNSEACSTPVREEPRLVAISEVTSNPSNYDGEYVAIDGYHYAGFELNAIFPSARDPGVANTSEGLWVTGVSPFAGLGDGQVTLQGIIRENGKGHMNIWPASICVTSVKFTAPVGQPP